MTFFDSHSTPLYSLTWSPENSGSYAGTCIFLVVLGVVLRGLLALRVWKESVWAHANLQRRYITVADKATKAESMASDSDTRRLVLSANGVEEDVFVVQKRAESVQPWRITVDPLRAVIDTIIAGVGYLM